MFYLIKFGIPSNMILAVLRTGVAVGGGGLLNKQNPLSVTKVICRWSLIHIAFFWEVSHLCTVWRPGLFYSLIKVLSVFLSITSSFWSFIVPCCSLILLLPNIVSSEGLFRYGTSISDFQICLVLGSPHKHFLFYCFSSLPALIVLRALANLLE